MIIVKKLDGNIIKIKDLSDKSCINLFKSLNRFEYVVDFTSEKIYVEEKKEKRKDEYDCCKSLIVECLNKTCEDYCIHKKNDESRMFYDEIHFVGIIYIDCIKKLSKEDMYKANLEIKSNLYDDGDTKKDYRMIIERNSNSQVPFIKVSDDETWWINDDGFLPRQSIEETPSFIELMGCFSREERAIYLCDENINTTLKGLESYDGWFKYYKKHFKKLIVLHEIGHSIFQFTKKKPKEPILDETRANYFASYHTNGRYDDKIYLLTCFQPFIYKFPFLSFDYMIKKTKTIGYYKLLKRDYYRKVDELYE